MQGSNLRPPRVVGRNFGQCIWYCTKRSDHPLKGHEISVVTEIQRHQIHSITLSYVFLLESEEGNCSNEEERQSDQQQLPSSVPADGDGPKS
ncbi:hypothetical protein PROFUN_02726 [Planoprotostelium fungivorum]|uniref:Uncharacterized protein n=1 Tax=Planoprotostelium fungivorum TaxID=1890364 RepID=A0A2P6NVJ8_9EUKA|nr:hypothetical protein PROFUN_02726 [Planoprotostelium fungivorum]